MKKYLKYELKRNLLPIVVFTAIACIITCLVNVFSDTYNFYRRMTEDGVTTITYRIGDSLILTPTIILCALCVIVPVMQFSYRMTSRGADLWFAMPIKRETFILVRVIVGLIMVAIPYTVCYWLNFFIILARENYYVMYGYVLYYLASLLPAVIMFGFYSFIFSCANTILDGLLFMAMWTFVLVMPMLFLDMHDIDYSNELTFVQLTPFGAIATAEQSLNALICGDYVNPELISGAGSSTAIYLVSVVQAPETIVLAWVVPISVVEGAGSYAGLFLTARRQKSEDSEQLSSSLWGYRTLVPYYIFATMASIEVLDDATFTLMISAILLIGGYILFVAYRRSFKVKLADILSIVIAFAVGFAVSVIVYYATPEPEPDYEAFTAIYAWHVTV